MLESSRFFFSSSGIEISVLCLYAIPFFFSFYSVCFEIIHLIWMASYCVSNALSFLLLLKIQKKEYYYDFPSMPLHFLDIYYRRIYIFWFCVSVWCSFWKFLCHTFYLQSAKDKVGSLRLVLNDLFSLRIVFVIYNR